MDPRKAFTLLPSYLLVFIVVLTGISLTHGPTMLAGTAVSFPTIYHSWIDNSTNETGFKIERGTAISGPFEQIALVGEGVTSYQNTGLSPETTYYYRVQAANPAGDSAYSNIASATTQAEPLTIPAAPSNLSATYSAPDTMQLAWTDNATNETGFKIERAPTSGGSWVQIALVDANTTEYTDTGLTAQTEYFYRVRATNSAGDSAYSNTASVITPIDVPAGAPSNLTAQAISHTQINLAWTDNSTNETSFPVERTHSSTGSGSEGGSAAPNVTSSSAARLSGSTHSPFLMRAFADGSATERLHSHGSNMADALALMGASSASLSAPAGEMPTGVPTTQVSHSWTNSSNNKTGLRIQCSAVSGGSSVRMVVTGPNETLLSVATSAAATTSHRRGGEANSAGGSAATNMSSSNGEAPAQQGERLVIRIEFPGLAQHERSVNGAKEGGDAHAGKSPPPRRAGPAGREGTSRSDEPRFTAAEEAPATPGRKRPFPPTSREFAILFVLVLILTVFRTTPPVFLRLAAWLRGPARGRGGDKPHPRDRKPSRRPRPRVGTGRASSAVAIRRWRTGGKTRKSASSRSGREVMAIVLIATAGLILTDFIQADVWLEVSETVLFHDLLGRCFTAMRLAFGIVRTPRP